MEITPVPVQKEAGWVPGPVCTFWNIGKYLFHGGIRNPDRPARTLENNTKHVNKRPGKNTEWFVL